MKDRFKTLSLLLFNLLQLLYILNPVSENKLETQLSPKKKNKNPTTLMHWVSARDAPGITCSVVVTWGSGELELQH